MMSIWVVAIWIFFLNFLTVYLILRWHFWEQSSRLILAAILTLNDSMHRAEQKNKTKKSKKSTIYRQHTCPQNSGSSKMNFFFFFFFLLLLLLLLASLFLLSTSSFSIFIFIFWNQQTAPTVTIIQYLTLKK